MHSYNTITDYILTDFILQSRPAYRKLMKKIRPDDTPAIKGISEKVYERLADTVVVVPSGQYSEPVTVGEYTKAVSNLDCDPTAIFNRM